MLRITRAKVNCLASACLASDRLRNRCRDDLLGLLQFIADEVRSVGRIQGRFILHAIGAVADRAPCNHYVGCGNNERKHYRG
jgi:hypothetical protein